MGNKSDPINKTDDMFAMILWLSGSVIFLVLGTLHLYYTFFTNKFKTRNKNTEIEMKNTSPVLTKDTTMWKSWIGFNASHSAGAIFIGLINAILAVQYFSILQNSVSLLLLNCITVIFYLWLAKRYWFSIPFTGILITACCFVTASLILFLSK
jgi:hypothetical protein